MGCLTKPNIVITIFREGRYTHAKTEKWNAEKVEQATQMPAHVMLRFETRWREKLAYATEHPEIPAYLGEEIVNRPKKEKRIRKQKITS